MKNCKRCSQEKPLTEFQYQKRGIYNSNCKPCQIDYYREYKANYPEQIKKRSAIYYQKNKERIKARNLEKKNKGL